MKRLLTLCLLVAVVWWPTRVLGQTCTARMDDVRFGDIDPMSNRNTDVTGEVTVTCSRILAPWVRVCIHMGSPTSIYDPRRMQGPGVRRLAFNIYKDAAHTQIWGSHRGGAFTPQFVDIPLAPGGSSAAVPYFARVPGHQGHATAGVYTATYSTRDLFIEWAGYFLAPPDCGQRLPDSAQFSSVVTANVVGECTVSATDIDFGQVTSSINVRPVESVGVITMNCTNNLNYSIALDAGQGSAATVAMRMLTRFDTPNLLRYGLYVDRLYRRTWGDGTLGTETVHDRGTGYAQTFTVHGQIPPQPNPPAGSYADSVQVTVTY
jgi:spore coat protein U-like protein